MKIPDFKEFISPSSDIAFAAARRIMEILSEFYPLSDLSKALIIVPTRSAARALHRNINSYLMQSGNSAVGGIRIFTQETLIGEIVRKVSFANVFESYNAWFKSFDSLKTRRLDALFPRGNPSRSDYPALVKRLLCLRRTLSESSLSIGDVSRILCSGEDSKRWEDLAFLESQYLGNLASIGKIPQENAPMEAENLAPYSFPEVEKIFLVGLADPSPAFIKILESMAGKSIGVISFASEGDWKCFDSWGRPISSGNDAWSSRNLPVSASCITVVANLREQSGAIAESVSKYGCDASRAVAVACGEPDSSKSLINALAERGIDAYIPEGIPLSSIPQILLLKNLSNFLQDDSYRTLAVLLRNPCMGEYLSARANCGISDILAAVDSLFDDTAFDSSKSALALASRNGKYALAAEVLRILKGFLDDVLSAENPAEGLSILFTRLFADIKLGVEFEDPAEVANRAADFLQDCLEDIAALNGSFRGFSVSEAVEIIIEAAEKIKIPPAKSSRSVALLDWMEIFWAPQAHIILADMNDGIVPQKVSDNFFIPDSIKQRLNIRDSKMRHCRDAWMLYVIAKSRAECGMLSVVVPRRRLKEPAQASRLLLQCPDSELASRVETLFSLPESREENSPFEKSWNLKVPRAGLPEKLSVSAFKSYLACPFRFYLDYVLRLKGFDPFAPELGRDKLGTLVHAAMERFMSWDVANSKDETEILNSLLKAFDLQQDLLYGRDVSAALLFQLRSVRESLAAAAPIQAGLRRDGYATVATEKYLDNLQIGNFRVSMRIDRIDANDNGDLLIIDYKTKDSPVETSSASAAENSHRRKSRGANGEKNTDWIDLQLPLYKSALKLIYPDRKISCAHFIISGNPEKTQLSEWDIDNETMDSALACANSVAEKISSGKFEPAQKPPYFDNYKDLFAFAQDSLKDFLEFENEK